jgi:NADH-quinone oxidoreductase subunit J
VAVIDTVLFYVFGSLALVAGVAVVAQRNTMVSAVALIVALCSLSAVYGLLGSPFIAVLQIIVYAGAIMVLFLFVIMLLNVRREEAPPPGDRRLLRGAAVVFALLLGAQVAAVLRAAGVRPLAASFDASTKHMAQVLFSVPYLYAFEATSILILAALVGAVVLAKKELP